MAAREELEGRTAMRNAVRDDALHCSAPPSRRPASRVANNKATRTHGKACTIATKDTFFFAPAPSPPAQSGLGDDGHGSQASAASVPQNERHRRRRGRRGIGGGRRRKLDPLEVVLAGLRSGPRGRRGGDRYSQIGKKSSDATVTMNSLPTTREQPDVLRERRDQNTTVSMSP